MRVCLWSAAKYLARNLDMYSSRHHGSVSDLHNNHTVSSLMRATARSALSHYPQQSSRQKSRSKTNLNASYSFRSPSTHKVCIISFLIVIYLQMRRRPKNVIWYRELHRALQVDCLMFVSLGWKSRSGNWTTSSSIGWWSISGYSFTWIKTEK